MQARTCIDANSCGTIEFKLPETRDCAEEFEEEPEEEIIVETVKKITENQLKEYAEVFNAILKPEAFIYIDPKNEKTVRSLAEEKEQFYIKYKDKDFLIRLFDRKKP